MEGVLYYDAGSAELNWLEGSELKTKTASLQKDWLVMLSYAYNFGGRAFTGFTLKAVNSVIAEQKLYNALSADAGIAVPMGGGIMASLAVKNYGISAESNLLPSSCHAGINFVLKASRKLWRDYILRISRLPQFYPGHSLGRENFYLSGGIMAEYYPVEAAIVPEAGFELGYGFLTLSAGCYLNGREQNTRVGLGIDLGTVELGYRFMPSLVLGPVHGLNVEYHFSGE